VTPLPDSIGSGADSQLPKVYDGDVRVLVVDDSDMVRKVLGAMVGRLGHEAVCVGNGSDALAADPCDVVLLDLELPDQSGHDVARALRARGVTTRIFGISGHEGVAAACRASGMNGNLQKPFVLDDVAALLGVSRAFHDLGEDEDLLHTMLAGVVEEVPRLVAEARKTQDLPELRRIAHTVRGALRFLEAPRASRAAEALETAAKEGSLSPEALTALEAATNELIPRLAQLLESSRGSHPAG